MEQSTLNLVMRAKQGDEKAIAALVKLYHPSVKQTIRSYIGNEADYKPVETQAFANAFTHFNTLQNPKDFESWLDGYVRKESVNHLLNPIANAVKEADNAPSRPSAPENYEMPHFNSEETGVQPSAGDPEFRKEIDASDLYSLFSDAPAPKKPAPAPAESAAPQKSAPVQPLKQEIEDDEEEEEDTVPRRRPKKQEEEPKKKRSLKSIFMEEDEDDDEDEEDDEEEEEAPRRKPSAPEPQEVKKPRTLRSTYEEDDEDEDDEEEDSGESGGIPGGVLVALIVILAVIALGLGTYFIAPGIYNSTFGKLPFLPSAETTAAAPEATAAPTPTAAPTATPEPSASASAEAAASAEASTSSVIGTVTVNVSGLNIRSSASTAGEKVGTAESGKSYDVLSTSNDGTYTWYQIGENQYIADNGSWCTYKAN
ncbi:MAG: SH3 domain-containing protein [Bulleidia sp.]